MYEKWKELVHEAGVIEGRGLNGITVRQVAGAEIDDIVLCPPAEAENRIRTLATGRMQRRPTPERVFMARALRSEAETAAALLVRAVIGRWVHSRGKRGIEDLHEKRAWAVLENHLRAVGHQPATDVVAGRQQIADTQIRPPVAHDSAADVVRKAIAQMARQIDGRHVIVMGRSPLAV